MHDFRTQLTFQQCIWGAGSAALGNSILLDRYLDAATTETTVQTDRALVMPEVCASERVSS